MIYWPGLSSHNTGIGAAVAKAFAKGGCSRIAITDINKASLADTHDAIRSINPKAQICASPGDIADEHYVKSFVKEAFGKFNRIDYSIQCAGILGKGLRSHETTIKDFDLINSVNYKGTWMVSREVLARMVKQQPLEEHPKQRGAIVNIASQLGIVARSTAGKQDSKYHCEELTQ